MRAIRFSILHSPCRLPLVYKTEALLKVCYEICIALASTALNASTAIERSETKQQNLCEKKNKNKNENKRTKHPKTYTKALYSTLYSLVEKNFMVNNSNALHIFRAMRAFLFASFCRLYLM